MFGEFRSDPEKHKLRTPSGKIELYSEKIAGFGYDDCPPHATWIEPWEWLGGADAKTYPLHLVSSQPRDRLHSQMDSGPVSAGGKVAGREAMSINPADAAARGISDGDVVRVFNARGACLAGAIVTDTVSAGVVRLSCGACKIRPTTASSRCAVMATSTSDARPRHLEAWPGPVRRQRCRGRARDETPLAVNPFLPRASTRRKVISNIDRRDAWPNRKMPARSLAAMIKGYGAPWFRCPQCYGGPSPNERRTKSRDVHTTARNPQPTWRRLCASVGRPASAWRR